ADSALALQDDGTPVEEAGHRHPPVKEHFFLVVDPSPHSPSLIRQRPIGTDIGKADPLFLHLLQHPDPLPCRPDQRPKKILRRSATCSIRLATNRSNARSVGM